MIRRRKHAHPSPGGRINNKVSEGERERERAREREREREISDHGRKPPEHEAVSQQKAIYVKWSAANTNVAAPFPLHVHSAHVN